MPSGTARSSAPIVTAWRRGSSAFLPLGGIVRRPEPRYKPRTAGSRSSKPQMAAVATSHRLPLRWSPPTPALTGRPARAAAWWSSARCSCAGLRSRFGPLQFPSASDTSIGCISTTRGNSRCAPELPSTPRSRKSRLPRAAPLLPGGFRTDISVGATCGTPPALREPLRARAGAGSRRAPEGRR